MTTLDALWDAKPKLKVGDSVRRKPYPDCKLNGILGKVLEVRSGHCYFVEWEPQDWPKGSKDWTATLEVEADLVLDNIP